MNLLPDFKAKTLFWIVGFLVPLLLVIAQVMWKVGSTPLMILALTWFGIALFIYLGVYEEPDKMN